MLFSIVRIDHDCNVETMILTVFHCFLIIQNIYLLKRILLLLQKVVYKTCSFFPYFIHFRYIILSGQVQIQEEGKAPIILQDDPFSSFLQFSEVLLILLHSSFQLVSSSLLFLIHIAYSGTSINKCSSTCLNTKRTLFKRSSFNFIFTYFS